MAFYHINQCVFTVPISEISWEKLCAVWPMFRFSITPIIKLFKFFLFFFTITVSYNAIVNLAAIVLNLKVAMILFIDKTNFFITLLLATWKIYKFFVIF